MNEKVNVRQALRVFDLITRNGKRQGGEYLLNGLSASSGFDGYTVTLRNNYVTLDIFFHNKFSFQFSNKKEKMLFMDKLSAIDSKKYMYTPR